MISIPKIIGRKVLLYRVHRPFMPFLPAVEGRPLDLWRGFDVKWYYDLKRSVQLMYKRGKRHIRKGASVERGYGGWVGRDEAEDFGIVERRSRLLA